MTVLSPGDPVPWFKAATSSRPSYNFGTVAGRYVVLVFVSSSRSAAGMACIEAVNSRRSLFNDLQFAFFGVTADPLDQSQQRVRDDIPGVRWFYDPGGAIARSFGALDPEGEVATRWFLLDPMLRVMMVDSAPDRMLDLLSRLPAPGQHAGCDLTAPVLLILASSSRACARRSSTTTGKKAEKNRASWSSGTARPRVFTTTATSGAPIA